MESLTELSTKSIDILRQPVKFATDNNLALLLISSIGLMQNIQKELQWKMTSQGNIPLYIKPTKYRIDFNGILESTDDEILIKDIYFETVIGKYYAASNNSQQHFLILYADSQETINSYIEYITDKYKPPVMEETGLLYEWNEYHKCYIQTAKYCAEVKQTDLQGLDSYFDHIKKDIVTLATHSSMLEKLGLSSGFNYFLYGPPGTGKSSFVKALAHELKLPIFVVNLNNVQSKSIQKVLTPDTVTYADSDTDEIVGNFKIVLVEDFDRYLNGEGRKTMSELLNALDGMYQGQTIIRFFSANFPELVVDKAMKSRMRRMLHFDIPSKDNLRSHLLRLYPETDHKFIPAFIAELEKYKLDKVSMRSINMYLSRYLMEESPLEMATKFIPEWSDELNIKPSLDSQESKESKESKDSKDSKDSKIVNDTNASNASNVPRLSKGQRRRLRIQAQKNAE